MSIINQKPQMLGLPIIDFFALIIIEGMLVLFCMLFLAQINMILSAAVFVIVGGSVYAFISFKRNLPEFFFTNIIKYVLEPKIYLTSADINANSPILRKFIEETPENNQGE
jgi:hypothetical protein